MLGIEVVFEVVLGVMLGIEVVFKVVLGFNLIGVLYALKYCGLFVAEVAIEEEEGGDEVVFGIGVS